MNLFILLAFTLIILSFRTDRSGQTVPTQIRLLLQEQSDQGLHCLLFHLGLFQEKVSGWGGTEPNFFLRGAGVQKVSVFWVREVKHILVSWVVGLSLRNNLLLVGQIYFWRVILVTNKLIFHI